MTSDESDDEPLSVLAAAKRLNPEKFETYETETTIEVIRPSKKKKKKYSRNDTVSITIKLHQPIKTTRPPKIVERPTDVWMYIKDLNPTGPYSCLLCSEWFINRSKIILHYILNHKKDFCGICRYFVTERAVWQTHQKFHSPWPCSQCLDSFPTQVEWRKHFSVAHNLVHCRLCHFRTTDDDQYDVHLIEKHNVTNTESKNAEVIWEVEYLGCQNFLCLLCNKGDVFCNNFFNHYMGYHHFTLKCITNIISGNDPPFHVDGANVSTDFVTDQFNIKTGYLELEKKPDIADVQNEQDSGVKQEPLSDNENKEAKNSIVETYKGVEDFDVTLMELIVLNKCYFEYVNQTLSQINSNTVPEDSGIDYKTANDDVELDIECGVCKTCVTSIHTFSTHMLKMHSVRSVPIYSCRVCATTFESQGELEAHVTEEMGEFDDLWLCQFCDKEFDNRESTRKHLNSHWDVMEFDNCFSPHLGFKCKYCPTLFWNEPDRETHQIRVHFVKYKEDFYKCENCSEIFSDKIWFIHHYVEKHQLEQEELLFLVKCCVCCLVLNTVEDMRAHFEKQHSDARKIFCSLGACVFKPLSQRKSFKVHIKTVHATEEKKPPRPEVCTICTREFNSSRACATHMAQAHGARNYKCKLCRDVLHTVDERKLHYLIRHPGKHPYECSECGKSFQYKSSLYMHKQVHAPNKPTYTCSFCGKVFMVSYLRPYQLVLRPSLECGKSFQYKSSLYMHKQVHAPNKPTYTCSFCGKVFMKKDSYREHIQIHEGPRHACSYCPMRFVQRSNMLRHERRHTGERPYACPQCPRTFSDKGACTSHARTHTKDRSYACIYCGQTFVQKSKLTYHVRKHTGENLETCQVCSKLFTSACSLREHMKIHDRHTKVPVQCPLCDRKYQDERYMLRHIRTSHTHVRYTCPLCRKELTSPAGLRLHVVTHGQANMYKCKSCPKTYAVKRTMIRHIRKRHMPKNTSRAPREFYQKLDPRECCLPLDEEAMTKIFGPPKKKSSENVIRDFVTFTKGLKLPENPPANDGGDDDDDDDDDDEDLSEDGSQDKDSEGESEVDEKTPQKTEEEAELEPTDFVSVKIEHVEEDVEEEQ